MPRNVVIALTVVSLLAVMLPFASASAANLDMYRDRIAAAGAALAESTAQLKAAPPEKWTDVQLQTYLHDALWVVEDGLLYHLQKAESLPDDVAALAGTEYVPEWPGNPFADWAPMDVLTIGDGFKPGCLVMQVCPPDFYSDLRSPRPLSFELAIYGPTKEFASLGSAHPMKYNTWATVPEGAYYMLGAFTESVVSLRKKRDKIKAEMAKEK